MDKNNELYTEIKSLVKVTLAESTIAWFYSGRKQKLITNEIRHPVYADGEYDCTEKLQQAVDLGSIYLPEGIHKINSPIILNSNSKIIGDI